MHWAIHAAHDQSRLEGNMNRENFMGAFLGRAIVRTAVAAIGIVVVTGVGHAQIVPPGGSSDSTNGAPAQPWDFTKQALDANGAALVGSVAVGQTIQYVLSYKPGASSSGPVNIVDDLSSNLAYVNQSIVAPPGWTWTKPEYNGNHEVYSNPGFGPGTSFIVNVPVSDLAQSASSGGDGTFPIPVGGSVYEIYHHTASATGPAQIMCRDLYSFAPCPPVSLQNWPLSLGPGIITPTNVHHVVVNSQWIYYPAARNNSLNNWTFGIGCWKPTTNTPCPFVPSGAPAYTGVISKGKDLDNLIAGIVEHPTIPGRLFILAGQSTQSVYCVQMPAGAPCPLWINTPFAAAGTGHAWDIMVEGPTPTPTRLYVGHGGTMTGPNAMVSCVKLTDGAPCPLWTGGQATLGQGLSLSPLLDTTGVMIGVCRHSHESGLPACHDATTGASVNMPTNLATLLTNSNFDRLILRAFVIPGTASVIYPHGSKVSTTAQPVCWDYKKNASCTSFNPEWMTVYNNNFEDYGYAVDPAEPGHCLLALGNAAILWRFTRDGGFGANGCVKRVEATFDINSFFCAIKPQNPSWDSIIVNNNNSVPELTGGTITLVYSTGSITIPITAGKTTYLIPLAVTGTQLTLKFAPVYSPNPPANGYQLEVKFRADDVVPHICYKATVTACGPVSNQAVMQGAVREQPVKATAGVNLGDAVGDTCEPPPPACCDTAEVVPAPSVTTTESVRCFKIFNTKVPQQPICSFEIAVKNPDGSPYSPGWDSGGGASVLQFGGHSLMPPGNYFSAPYTRIPSTAGQTFASLGLNQVYGPGNPAGEFCVGLDKSKPNYTQAVVSINVVHCCENCRVSYTPWVHETRGPTGQPGDGVVQAAIKVGAGQEFTPVTIQLSGPVNKVRYFVVELAPDPNWSLFAASGPPGVTSANSERAVRFEVPASRNLTLSLVFQARRPGAALPTVRWAAYDKDFRPIGSGGSAP
jgi:hypothetical protein